MRPFSIYWLLWLGLGFGIPEGWALFHDQKDTLSYQVWSVEGHGATFVRYFVAAFLLWLLLHMVFQWFK